MFTPQDRPRSSGLQVVRFSPTWRTLFLNLLELADARPGWWAAAEAVGLSFERDPDIGHRAAAVLLSRLGEPWTGDGVRQPERLSPRGRDLVRLALRLDVVERGGMQLTAQETGRLRELEILPRRGRRRRRSAPPMRSGRPSYASRAA